MSDPKFNDLGGDYVELTADQASRIRGGASLADVGLITPTLDAKGPMPKTQTTSPCKHDPAKLCCY